MHAADCPRSRVTLLLTQDVQDLFPEELEDLLDRLDDEDPGEAHACTCQGSVEKQLRMHKPTEIDSDQT